MGKFNFLENGADMAEWVNMSNQSLTKSQDRGFKSGHIHSEIGSFPIFKLVVLGQEL